MAEPANSMASSSCDHDSPALLASPHPHPWGKRVEELHEVAAGTRVAVWGKLVITGQPYANVFALYPAVVTRVNAGGIELRYHPTCRARPAEAWIPLSDGGYVRQDSIEIPEVRHRLGVRPRMANRGCGAGFKKWQVAGACACTRPLPLPPPTHEAGLVETLTGGGRVQGQVCRVTPTPATCVSTP